MERVVSLSDNICPIERRFARYPWAADPQASAWIQGRGREHDGAAVGRGQTPVVMDGWTGALSPDCVLN